MADSHGVLSWFFFLVVSSHHGVFKFSTGFFPTIFVAVPCVVDHLGLLTKLEKLPETPGVSVALT